MTTAGTSEEVLVDRVLVQGVRGHVVVARGDQDDVDSVAIWHVSAEGTLCGAWVWPWPTTVDDARRTVSLIDGRLLVDVNPDAAAGIVADLAESAAVADRPMAMSRVQRVAPGWLLEEVVAFRAELQKAFDEAVAARAAARGGKLVPLDFSPLPDQLTGDLAGQLASLGLQPPAGISAVIGHALGTANLVAWLIQLWQDAEGQRMRRSYLRSGAEARPLSAAWVTALRTAAAELLIRN